MATNALARQSSAGTAKSLPDRDLIAARNDSLKLEKGATKELRERIDGYLPPSYRARKMIDHWDAFIDNGGYTTEDIYLNFRAAAEQTRLESNRVFSWVLSDHIPKNDVAMTGSLFEDAIKQAGAPAVRMNGEDDGAAAGADPWQKVIDSAYKAIEVNGFWKCPVLAPPELVKSLRARVDRQLAPQQAEVDKTMAGKDGAQLAHWVYSHQACTFEELYQLASDPLLYSIAQKYLGVPPIFNTPVSILSGPVKVKADKEMNGSGQLYHYDMHRVKFVKMFIYLTDVGPGSGPHTVIRGTHKRRPDVLWEDRRHTQEDLHKLGVMKDEMSITGPAGTVFFVDTSAYHKGAHPLTDYRIMAQVQYTNTLFGKPIKPGEHKIELAQTRDSNTLQRTVTLVRKYAAKRGPRFMQNFI